VYWAEVYLPVPYNAVMGTSIATEHSVVSPETWRAQPQDSEAGHIT